MGIKGIYRELGPGRRVSLAKLTADSFDTSDRPFRIAIDVAIWQFQAQAAQGGTNPAIRTLFYRLARLLGTPVQAVFVFDGPKKPTFKRNKRSGRGDGVSTAQAKRLIRLFGFAIHDAPGEGEAECALLQVHGIVDAVLSEDVDTIMFGCTKTLRNWSAEGTSSKTPTHVSLYDVNDQAIASLGLGREGMVLVALMSGGDYLPEGIPGCGIKVACEAAKAGFGRSMCRLKASDEGGIRAWRESLSHELRTNENRHFRTKHKALVVPSDFPSLEVLRCYTHPVVSPQSSLESVRANLQRKQELHLDALREFARETFGWDFRIGAFKFIRVLGQAMLVHNMCQQREDSQQYVKRITGRRQHFSTDATPELRMAYVPLEVVPIDLSKEVEENISSSRDGLALNSDVEYEAPSAAVEAGEGLEAAAGGGKTFDVAKPDLAWVLEGVARKTIPKAIQEWEAKQAKAAPKPPAKKKRAGGTKAQKTLSEDQKMLEQYFRIAKGPSMARMAGTGSKATLGTDKPFRPPSMRNSSPFRSLSPRQESKQSPPPALKIPASTAPWVVGSSPVMPRLCKPADRPETILISSSPVGSPAISPPPANSRPHTGPSLPDARKVPAPKPPSLATGGTCQRLSRSRRPTNQSTSTGNPAAIGTSARKQSSMDKFVSRSFRYSPSRVTSQEKPQSRVLKTTRRGKEKATDAEHDDSDASELEPLSALLSQAQGSPGKQRHKEQSQTSDVSPTPSPTGKEKATDAEHDDSDASELEPLSALLSQAQGSPGKQRHKEQSQTSDVSPTPSPTRKKKLLVPSASAVGFFGVIEVAAEEREQRMAREAEALKKRGNKGCGVVRWSDVSIIDLTGGGD